MPKKRRGTYGDGAVYWVKSRKRAAFVPPRVDGVRPPPTYFRTKAQAYEARRRWVEHRDAGLDPPSSQTTAAYLDEYLETTAPLKLRPQTIACRRAYFKRLKPLIGHIPLTDLTSKHIKSAYSDLLRAGASLSYLNSIHAGLNTALSVAVDDLRIPRNPAVAARPAAAPAPDHTTFSPDQIALLIEHERGSRWEALWTTIALTGIRPGEAAALQWKDIDWNDSLIHIRGSATRAKPGPTKNPGSIRPIWMHPTVADALHRHRAIIDRLELEAATWSHQFDPVFPNTTGGFMQVSTINHHLQTICKACGLPTITTHELRHTFATLQLDTTNEHVVSAILGHASAATTSRYSHTRTEHQADTIRRLADKIHPTPSQLASK